MSYSLETALALDELRVGRALVRLAQTHRAEAAFVEQRFGANNSTRIVRSIADEYERVVLSALPSWFGLASLCEWTGWSGSTIRKWAIQLEPEGLGRPRPYRIHRDAAIYLIHRADFPSSPRRRRNQWQARQKRVSRAVFKRDGRICLHCGSEENLTIDHKIPILWGGSDDLTNLQVLCRRCNACKGSKIG